MPYANVVLHLSDDELERACFATFESAVPQHSYYLRTVVGPRAEA
jgi:hypothetical protein